MSMMQQSGNEMACDEMEITFLVSGAVGILKSGSTAAWFRRRHILQASSTASC
ncbi:hypothetical protein PO124_26230 [Bacillus licheniformis]|nr:hypothetical protein [Bacillus licheniformis]